MVTAVVALAAGGTALAILLMPFALLVNFMPLQRMLLSLVGTTGGLAPRFGTAEALRRTGDLLRYLAFRLPLPDDGFYSTLERVHMADVQSIFQIVYLAALVSSCVAATALLLLAHRDRALARRAVGAGSITVLVLVIVLGTLVVTIGFDTLFISFHELAFSNDFWLLPEDSGLIRLFPENYFMSYFFVVLAASVVVALVLTILSLHKRQRPL